MARLDRTIGINVTERAMAPVEPGHDGQPRQPVRKAL
jgi:hypothetical protein